jgi:hypothetical protein
MAIAVHLPPAGTRQPPLCFYRTALRNLMADASDRAFVVADPEVSQSDELFAALQLEVGRRSFVNRTDEATIMTATRAIGSSRLHLPIRRDLPLRPHSKPLLYSIAWIWCPPWQDNDHGASAHCGTLHGDERALARTEVHARFRPDAHVSRLAHNASAAGRGGCSDAQLQVRSTHAPVWQSLPTSDEFLVSSVANVRGSWERVHSCLAFDGVAGEKMPVVLLAQAHPESGELLWPLPLPAVRTEYNGKWAAPIQELGLGESSRNHLNASTSGRVLPKRDQCDVHPNRSLFVMEMTMGNLFHALHHAVPSAEHFATLPNRTIDVVPVYLFYYPGNVAADAGFQLSLYALGAAASGSSDGVNDAQQLAGEAAARIKQGRCHCYRSIHGGHGTSLSPFERIAINERRFASIANRVATAIGVPPPTPATPSPSRGARMLFIERSGKSRIITNAAVMRAAVLSDSTLATRVSFVSFDGMRVIDQLRLVMTSSALASVHGQALTWCAFLSGRHRACLEIIGAWPNFARTDYRRWSAWGSARYFRLVQNNSACEDSVHCDFRSAGNVTADTAQIVGILHTMANHLDQ